LHEIIASLENHEVCLRLFQINEVFHLSMLYGPVQLRPSDDVVISCILLPG